MTGRSVCFGLFSLSYLRLECDVDYAYNAPSADSMRNRRGNCFEKNLIFLPTGVRCVTVRPAHYRTRGGEWRGCIAATPHIYMVSAVRKGINEWRKPVARKLISSEIDSISPDGQSLPVLRLPTGGNVYVQNFPF
jgi:hypothetical protein